MSVNQSEGIYQNPLNQVNLGKDLMSSAAKPGGTIKATEQEKLVDLIKSDNPNPNDIYNFVNSTHFDQFRSEAIGLLLALTNSANDGILSEMMTIISADLGGSGEGLINPHMVALMIEQLADSTKASHPILQDKFRDLLDNVSTNFSDNETLQIALRSAENIYSGNSIDGKEPINVGLPAPGTATLPEGAIITPQTSNANIAKSLGFVEKTAPDATNKEFASQDKTIGVRTGITDTIDVTLPNASAHAVANINHGVGAVVVQVGNLPPIMVISQVAAYLLVKLSRLRDKRNLYKFAIVTDSVASVVRIDKQDNIRFVDIAKEISEESFVSIYQDLIDEGYMRIISLHLNPKLSRTYMHAKAAVERIKESTPEVHMLAVNTRANGVGLGLIISEVNQAIIDHYSPAEVLHLIQECTHNLRYWVVPMAFNYNRNQKWMASLLDSKAKLKLKMFRQKPVISLKEKIEILGMYSEDEQAISFMLSQLDEEVTRRRGKARRIGVEYRQLYRRAIALNNTLKVKYQNVPITSHVAGSVTATAFGPEMIGICII